MADTESGAILMAFFLQPNLRGAIDGESTTSLKAADGVSDLMLMDGFAPNKMFEVDKFTFSTKLDDADQTSTAELGGVVTRQGQMITQQGQMITEQRQMITQLQQGHAAARGKAGSLRGDPITAPRPSFARWRASKSDADFKGQNGRNGYPVNVQPVTFSRHVDTTSFKLMEKFLNGEPFRGAALVKRKPAGTKA